MYWVVAMQNYADTIATYNQSIINSAVPQPYWLQVVSTGFTQGLLSSPWWSSFCDGTCEKFSHCICIHLVWGLGQKRRLFVSTPKGNPASGWLAQVSQQTLWAGIGVWYLQTAYAHHHPADERCGSNQLYMHLSTSCGSAKLSRSLN